MSPEDPTLTNAPAQSQRLFDRAGKYRITGRIGQGGMGVVYRGVDDDLGRTVALKFIPSDLTEDSTAAQRFLREARAASALDHVNIGTIFGVEETADHKRFIVMAYYEGRNLSDRIKDTEHPLSASEATSIAVQVARGLAEAHAHGVIHRDIKPSNILLTTQGGVKIVDFGLASMSDAEQLTMTGVRMGTPAYMSPEQASGEQVDHRSDIWSLGVVLLEMLTGERPFHGTTAPGVLYMVVHGKVTALERVQEPMRSVLARALAKDPGKRYQSVNEFLAELEPLQPRSVTISPAGKFGRKPWRRGLIPAAAVLAVIAGAGAYMAKAPKAGKDRVIAGASKSSTVFAKYLQAVELMTRWDKEGNLEKATALLTEATKSDPGFALGFARLAEAHRLHFALSRDKTFLDAANVAAEEAMRLNPDLAPVQVVWGRVQASKGNGDLAMASFERAVKIDPNDADAQLAIGRQYERLGRLDDAEAAFQKAVSLEPDGIAAHDFYANFLFRQGRHADAIREWQTVVRIAPDNAPAWVGMGASMSDSGRTAEAIDVYKKALQLKPTDVGYSNLGAAYSRTGRDAEAVEAFRQGLNISQGNYLIWGNLASAYARLEQAGDKAAGSKAKEAFSHAISLAEKNRKDNPRDAAVHRSLAGYYALTGQSVLAQQRIGTALILSPKSPDIQAGAAEVYELLGDRTKALASAKRALELGYPRGRVQQSAELSRLAPLLK